MKGNFPKLLACFILLFSTLFTNVSFSIAVGPVTLNPTYDVLWDDMGVYPSEQENFVGFSGYGHGIQKTALKFNLSSIEGVVESAKLRIFVIEISYDNLNDSSIPYINLFGLSNDGWDSNPGTSYPQGDHDVQIGMPNDSNLPVGVWKEFNVTDFVKSELATDPFKIVSFGLRGNEVNENGAEFRYASKPSFNAPQLVIQTSPAASLPPAISPTVTDEDTKSTTGLVITPNDMETSYFKIDGLIGGRLYKANGEEITNNTFITKEDGQQGLRFLPNTNANSPAGDQFTFNASAATDSTGEGLSTGTSAAITVNEVNDAPISTHDTLPPIIVDSGTRTIPFEDILSNDSAGPANESGQTITVNSVTNGIGGTVTISGTQVLFTPTPDYRGPANFQYTIEDNGTTRGVSDSKTSEAATVSFNIEGKTDSPIVTPLTTSEDTLSTEKVIIQPTHAGDSITTHFKISNITGGTLYKADGTTILVDNEYITVSEGEEGLRFKPAADTFGTSGFGFQVQSAASQTDDIKLSAPVPAPIIVTEVNDAPVAVDDTRDGIKEDSDEFQIPIAALLGNDSTGADNESGQELILTLTGTQTGGSARISGNDIIFTPAPNYSGTASFEYKITDNGTTNGVADPKDSISQVTIPIEPVADIPLVTGTTTAEDEQSFNGLVVVPNPVDGSEIKYFKISGIIGGKLYKNDGVTQIHSEDFIALAEGQAGLKFTPDPDSNTPAGDQFSFQVQAVLDNSGTGISDSAAANITVEAVNDAPVAMGDTLDRVTKGTGKIIIPFSDLLGNDSNGPSNEANQELTIVEVNDPTGGYVSIKDEKVEFDLNANFVGEASFTYIIQDNGEFPKTSQTKVTVDVVPVPVITLAGESPLFLLQGENYFEPGYAASDEIDGDLTSEVTVVGAVDKNQLGSYKLNYNVSNSKGVKAQEVIRNVRVVSNKLQSLSVGRDGLTPAFDPDKDEYSLIVNNSIDELDVSANTLDSTATMTLNGVTKDSGSENRVELAVGENKSTFVVTAQGGTTKTYTLTVYRKAPAPSVSADDSANTIQGIDETMEYKIGEGSWISYDPQSLPDLVGPKKVKVRIKAAGDLPESDEIELAFTHNPPAAPDVSADDAANQIIGIDDTMEYQIDDGSWVSYDPSSPPVLRGNHRVKVRVKESGEIPPGLEKTLTFTAASSGGGGGSAPPSPKEEDIVVPVDSGGGENLTQTPIKRTTEPDGTVKDKIIMSESIAKRTVEKAKEQGADTARIVIPDATDKVAETRVEIPKEAVSQLSRGKINLEISTENTFISLPFASLEKFSDDLYFRVVPMKKESERKQVEDRAKQEKMIQDVVKNKMVKVLGRPMEIETNMQNHEVTLVLPLRDSLPKDPSERQNVLNNLGVYIEHSDGTKELIQGKLVNKNNVEGLEFAVKKFSTFTMVYMDGWKDYLDQQQPKPRQPYIKGYDDGTFRPEAWVKRSQMAAMLARNLPHGSMEQNASDYADVAKNYWGYKEIMKVKDAGIMVGNANQFNPENSITRAQMATIAHRWILQSCEKDETSFSSCSLLKNTDTKEYKDVTSAHWAAEAIFFMRAADIMKGYENNTFQPNEKLTRAQAVKVLNRLFERGSFSGGNQPTFTDVPLTHWAFEEIEKAAN